MTQLAASASTTGTLSHGDFILVLAFTIAGVLLSGLVVILGRRHVPPKNTSSTSPPAGQGGDGGPGGTVIRSWLAIALVFGLLLFCGVAFAIPDQSLRSSLIGGLVASAGAAVAFYFSSKSSDQARADILSAAFGTAEVPNLVGMTLVEAKKAMASTALSLRVESPSADDTSVVNSQQPDAHRSVRAGTTVVVTAAPAAATRAAEATTAGEAEPRAGTEG
jgi:hypothetical protein